VITTRTNALLLAAVAVVLTAPAQAQEGRPSQDAIAKAYNDAARQAATLPPKVNPPSKEVPATSAQADPIADAVNAAREHGTETVVGPPRTGPAPARPTAAARDVIRGWSPLGESFGDVEAIRYDDRLVVNVMVESGGIFDAETHYKPVTYYYTPAGQLPACNSAEAVEILARITSTTLNGIYTPKALGASDGKNICSARIRVGYAAPSTYTIEWLDKSNGKYWVQITGSLAQ
jgi:hypothetical protein